MLQRLEGKLLLPLLEAITRELAKHHIFAVDLDNPRSVSNKNTQIAFEKQISSSPFVMGLGYKNLLFFGETPDHFSLQRSIAKVYPFTPSSRFQIETSVNKGRKNEAPHVTHIVITCAHIEEFPKLYQYLIRQLLDLKEIWKLSEDILILTVNVAVGDGSFCQYKGFQSHFDSRGFREGVKAEIEEKSLFGRGHSNRGIVFHKLTKRLASAPTHFEAEWKLGFNAYSDENLILSTRKSLFPGKSDIYDQSDPEEMKLNVDYDDPSQPDTIDVFEYRQGAVISLDVLNNFAQALKEHGEPGYTKITLRYTQRARVTFLLSDFPLTETDYVV